MRCDYCLTVQLVVALLCICGSAIPTAVAASPHATSARIESSQRIRVMTTNVRYGTADDGDNRWERRRDLLVDVLQQEDADVIGTQEMLPLQAEYLQSRLPQYEYVGRSRSSDDPQDEQCGIFYRRDRFVELERGYFWLSETPERPGSQGWDADLPRIATWLKLFDQTSERVVVIVNTHFDHRGQTARRESAALIKVRVEQWATHYPVIVTGDFNSLEDSEPYRAFVGASHAGAAGLLDVYRQMHPERQAGEGTFTGFTPDRGDRRIDWILASPSWHPLAAKIVTTTRDGRWPSDHLPVVADLAYPVPDP